MAPGGIGSMLAQILCSSDLNAKLHIKGLNDFVGSGKPNELEKDIHLTAKA